MKRISKPLTRRVPLEVLRYASEPTTLPSERPVRRPKLRLDENEIVAWNAERDIWFRRDGKIRLERSARIV